MKTILVLKVYYVLLINILKERVYQNLLKHSYYSQMVMIFLFINNYQNILTRTLIDVGINIIVTRNVRDGI